MLASFVTFMNHRARLALLMCGALGALIVLVSFSLLRGTPDVQAGAVIPSGFQVDYNWSTANNTIINTPVAIEFDSNNKIYIGEKGGRIKVFDNWADQTPTLILNISDRVMNGYEGTTPDDRGMLGFTLHPNYPTTPYLYALYTTNFNPFTGQVWGDSCSAGYGTVGCPVFSRLSRFDMSSPNPTTTEVIMLQDFCQQFESHSVGKVAFGPDGALYVSHGDGANPDPSKTDYGQLPAANPNPCGDPPTARGVAPIYETANGGSFRSQGLQRPAGAAISLGGSVLRLDPTPDPVTGRARPMADNPLVSHPMTEAQMMIAHGMRNPFRYTFKPGSNELWVGDVGAGKWEEINRIVSPTQKVENFGWPCYEGDERQEYFKSVGGKVNNICKNFYDSGDISVTVPYSSYRHLVSIVPNDGCVMRVQDGSSISALAFYKQGNSTNSFPVTYTNALFFGDYARQCIWVMMPGNNGLPDRTNIQPFARAISTTNNPLGPVDMKFGPDGSLYVVDIISSEVLRIRYQPPGNDGPPTAVIQVRPSTTGGAPYNAQLSANNSFAPSPSRQIVEYSWDFTNDGSYDLIGDENTAKNVNHIYQNPGIYTVKLRVKDDIGRTGTATATITVLDAPTPVFTTPTTTFKWAVGDTINVLAGATDPNSRPITLSYKSLQQHCPGTGCHSHIGPGDTLTNTNQVSWQVLATDHPYPTFWILELTATNDLGASRTITRAVYPKIVTATILSNPPGAKINFGEEQNISAPFTRSAIISSNVTVSAPPTQTIAGKTYCFSSWSDGGENVHEAKIPQTDFTLTANYSDTTAVNSVKDSFDANDPCDITLRRAIANAEALGKTEIAFSPSLNLSGGITVSSSITLPVGFAVKSADGCNTRLKINATSSAAFILSGGNTIEGLNIETTIGPALRSSGGGNVIRCSSFKVKTAS